jgi:hypothetical protein
MKALLKRINFISINLLTLPDKSWQMAINGLPVLNWGSNFY